MFGIKDITIIAVFSAILFIQEQLFAFIPNVQLTVFLLVLYSKVFGFKKTIVIVFIHVLLDNIVNGSLNLVYFPFMLIGWSLIPIGLHTVFKKVNGELPLAFLGVLFSFLYCFMFIIPSCIVYEYKFIEYLMVDVLWELVLALSSFLTILWLYKPCARLLNNMINKDMERGSC